MSGGMGVSVGVAQGVHSVLHFSFIPSTVGASVSALADTGYAAVNGGPNVDVLSSLEFDRQGTNYRMTLLNAHAVGMFMYFSTYINGVAGSSSQLPGVDMVYLFTPGGYSIKDGQPVGYMELGWDSTLNRYGSNFANLTSNNASDVRLSWLAKEAAGETAGARVIISEAPVS